MSVGEVCQRAIRRAPGSGLLALSCLAVYLYALVLTAFTSGFGFPFGAAFHADLLLRLGGSYGPAIAAGEGWRLASAAFIHGSLLHLGANLIALVDIAPRLEAQMARGQWWRLPALWLACAMAGFLLSVWWNPATLSVGASGGILGLYGFWFAGRLIRPGPANRVWQFRASYREHVALAVILLFVSVGFLVPGLDNAAHIGGLVFGSLAGLVIRLGRPRVQWLSAGLALTLCLVGISQIPGDLVRPYQQRKAFEATYAHFVRIDQQANTTLGTLIDEMTSQSRSNQYLAEQLERSVLPLLNENLSGWQRLEIDAPGASDAAVTDVQAARERAIWLQYCKLRIAAAQSLRLALLARTAEEYETALRRFDAANDAGRLIAEAAVARSLR